MKRLYVVNMFYPFDDYGETFLESEIDFFNTHDIEGSVKKHIFPIWAKDLTHVKKELPDYALVRPKKYDLLSKIWWCFKALTDRAFWQDVNRMINNKKLSFHNILKSICFVGQGNFYANQLIDDISCNSDTGDEIILYSYWMHLQAYIIVKTIERIHTKYNVRSISRCHRFDVYEYVQGGFIPARDYIMFGLNKIVPISEDARSYILNEYPMISDKINVSRLGTKDMGDHISPKTDTLRIVSCSWMRPVKRNKMILEAIKQADFPIEWTHIGDGEEYLLIKKQIDDLCKSNVKCRLLGRMSNDEVKGYYQNNDFDVFINVSESEGVPVSIMEAMSFGKIIIATNVGGTAEIVQDGVNGFLLPVKVDPKMILDTLKKIYLMNPAKHDDMCRTSRRMWEMLSNEKANYTLFWNELMA